MDGRDIGTVVFPDAELGIELSARSAWPQRRFDELIQRGSSNLTKRF
jgi:cytidylate kinase